MPGVLVENAGSQKRELAVYCHIERVCFGLLESFMAKKRGHHEGSIYQHSKGYWVGQVSLANGKKKYKYAKTQREARLWVDEQKRLLRDGLVVSNDQVTYGELLNRWFQEVARHNLRPATLLSHESMMRLHICPALGDIRLAKLTPFTFNLCTRARLMKACQRRRSITSTPLSTNRWLKVSSGVWLREMSPQRSKAPIQINTA